MKKLFTILAICFAIVAANAQNAMVTLEANNVWGDGTGYQMLLDNTHALYGTTIPATGNLTSTTNYSLFSNKIPVNADNSLSTSNVVVTGSVTIVIPAGTYDFCIVNPSPDYGVMFIAGGDNGRRDDFVFEADKHYTFTMSYDASEDHDLATITEETIPAVDLAAKQTILPAISCGLTNAETVKMKVQNTGASAITAFTAKYKIGIAGTPVSENVTGINLASGDEYTYTFTTPADLTIPFPDSVQTWIELTGDANTANDTTPWAYTGLVAPSTIPYTNNFDTYNIIGWNILDANNDGATWSFTYYDQAQTNMVAYYEYSETNAANDWLFSTCLNFATPGVYTLKFNYACYNEGYPEAMAAYLGTAQTAAAMTTPIATIDNIINEDFQENSSTFTISSPGVYYIGFKATSAADQYFLLLDNVRITMNETNNIESNNLAELAVYPNPANTVLNVSSSSGISQIEIYNNFGQLVYEGQEDTNITIINLSDFGAGMYTLRAVTQDGVITKKFNVVK
ncbi:MAG: DUF2436 domain-containing protein [Bacteroidales bacterium]|jgi:hypothetical protein|nr:DUF2436 domain-containing protein [Bacteroidales bacterium]